MALKVRTQRDYLKTEATVSLPANVAEVDELLKATKTNGRMIVLYNQGSIQGINIEQNSKLSEPQSAKVRALLDVKDEDL